METGYSALFWFTHLQREWKYGLELFWEGESELESVMFREVLYPLKLCCDLLVLF